MTGPQKWSMSIAMWLMPLCGVVWEAVRVCCIQLGLSEMAWLMVSCEMMFSIANGILLQFGGVVMWASIMSGLRHGDRCYTGCVMGIVGTVPGQFQGLMRLCVRVFFMSCVGAVSVLVVVTCGIIVGIGRGCSPSVINCLKMMVNYLSFFCFRLNCFDDKPHIVIINQ